jgi:hypothetical protein
MGEQNAGRKQLCDSAVQRERVDMSVTLVVSKLRCGR